MRALESWTYSREEHKSMYTLHISTLHPLWWWGAGAGVEWVGSEGCGLEGRGARVEGRWWDKGIALI